MEGMKKLAAGLLMLVSLAAFTPFAFAKVAPKKIVKKPAVVLSRLVRRATAECEDGTLYFGKHVKSACAAHYGVMQWFK